MQPTCFIRLYWFSWTERLCILHACMRSGRQLLEQPYVCAGETRGPESWLLQGPRNPSQGLLKGCVWIVWLRPTHLLEFVCVRQVDHDVPRVRTWVNRIWAWLCSRLVLCFITGLLCNSNFPSVCHCIFAMCERYPSTVWPLPLTQILLKLWHRKRASSVLFYILIS